MNRIYTTCLAFLIGASLLLSAAMAAELQDITVDKDDDRYSMRSEAVFDVEPQALYEVLTNFDLFKDFTSAIVESHNLDPDESGRPQFFARMEGCVLFWCRSFVREGHLVTNPVKEIIAVTNPEKSDFTFSRERWVLSAEGEGTKMVYEFEMVPAFWVPPIIGPFYIKRALKSGGEGAVQRIEAIAQRVAAELEPTSEKVVQSPSEQ